jgi:thiamine biosynthesis lipoprotein
MTTLRRARPYLGTLVEIVIDSGRASLDGTVALERAYAAVARVHALMSYHDPASELSNLNRRAAYQALRVSQETWQVLVAAYALSEASDGVFDVTVAPRLDRAGFQPRPAGVARADRHTSWRDIVLLPGRRVRYARSLRVDLGGIAKGYAVDCAIEALRRSGVTWALVNAGGDWRVLGAPGPHLHLRHPARPTTFWSMAAPDCAAATSAGYFRQRVMSGRQVAPMVHGRTGLLCDTGRSVTVLAQNCMMADALTKVVYADPARATPLLAHFGARAVIMDARTAGGECRIYDSVGAEGWHSVRVAPCRSGHG